jgi:sugar lactone lactonase YvrE
MTTTLPRPEIVVEGLSLPECPRWHEGALYFSDITAGRVYRLKPDDSAELLYESSTDYIGGLGFLDNGDLLAAASKQRQLLRIAEGKAEVFADLSAVCGYVLNDMIVVANRAYVSQPGYDVWTTSPDGMPDPTDLLFVSAEGDAAIAFSDMMSPNGVAVSPDGRTLYVAEATAMRVSCFTIDQASGALSNRRVFGVLPDGGLPDGICVDDQGAVWAAVPVAMTGTSVRSGPGVIRMIEGGQGTHVVPVEAGRRALACAFGGVDRKSLYICTVPEFHGSAAASEGQGRIERVSLDFAGAGRP